MRLPPVLVQPMAADDVAGAVGRIALGAPVNGTVEVGGPEEFRLDELVRRALAAWKEPREVVADPHARYYGIEMKNRTLVPGDDVRPGQTRFGTCIAQPAAKAAAATHQRICETEAGLRESSLVTFVRSKNAFSRIPRILERSGVTR